LRSRVACRYDVGSVEVVNDLFDLANRFRCVDCLCEVVVVVVYVSEGLLSDGVTGVHANAEVVLGCRSGVRVEYCVIGVYGFDFEVVVAMVHRVFLGFMPPRMSAIAEHRVIEALCDEGAAFFGVMNDFADVVFCASFQVNDVVPDCFHDGIDLLK